MKAILVGMLMAVRNVSESGCELWMQRRWEEGPFKGLWEFPGGKLEAQETPLQATVREIQEETDVVLDPEEVFPFKNYSYQYPDRSVVLYVHWTRNFAREDGWVNVRFDDVLGSLDRKIMPANEQIVQEFCRFIQNPEESVWEA